MESLSHLCDGFIQNDGVPDGVLDALRKFATSEPRQIIEPVQTYQHEEVERRTLCGRVMQALVDAKPTMDMTMTSVLWSLFVTAPVEQLRLFESQNTQPVIVDFLEMTRTRLGILLKTFLAKEPAISGPLPRSSRYETGVEKCLRRDGGCCTITGSATPHVCHIIPLSVTKRKRFITEAIRVIIGTYWGEARNRRLQALLSDNAEIYSARNAICLSPLLHHWWGLGYIALEPLEKLPNGTRVRLRWLRRASFSVWDKVPLDTDPNDYLHPPLVAGSFSIRDLRSGHPILDGSTFDLTSDDPLTEVSYDLLELQWDLLCMAVLCGAAEAADDPSWNPVDEDPVYSAEKLMRELELEEGGGSVEYGHETAARG